MRTDRELLQRIARGDEAAFDELWSRHASWLLLRLRRRAPEEAHDLLQETFLAVWRNAGGFSGEDAGGWLWTIASRRLVDSRRRTERQAVPREKEPSPAPSSEDEALAEMLDPRLEVALAQLSPELAAALQATVLDGLSTREAATVLGIAEGTVKSRTSRARAWLRGRLITPTPMEDS